jgi:hypothetical protein
METCIKIRKPQDTFPPDIRRAEEKISLLLGSCPSVTSSLSEETNTNLIAHNNNGHPLKTSSLNEETKTNLIAHNDSGKINLYNSNYP